MVQLCSRAVQEVAQVFLGIYYQQLQSAEQLRSHCSKRSVIRLENQPTSDSFGKCKQSNQDTLLQEGTPRERMITQLRHSTGICN
jgi:hypothetical protein